MLKRIVLALVIVCTLGAAMAPLADAHWRGRPRIGFYRGYYGPPVAYRSYPGYYHSYYHGPYGYRYGYWGPGVRVGVRPGVHIGIGW